MNADDISKVLNFIFVASGVPKSNLAFKWSVFAYPFWRNTAGTEVGFKVMVYKGVDSSRTRVAKMCLNHGINCLTGAFGANLTGVGAVGSGVATAGGKFGGLKDAFGVDIGAVQLATVLESGDASPRDIGNAIIASGKMLQYAIIRVDKMSNGYRIHYRGDKQPNSYTEWGVTYIKTINTNSTQYTVWPNGVVFKGASSTQEIIGNFKTGKYA